MSILVNGRPSTAGVREVNRAHPPSTCPLGIYDARRYDVLFDL